MADIGVFKIVAQALAIGMLVGVERYKARQPDEKRPAGVRTFTVISLLGATCSLFQEPAFTLATFLSMVVLFALAYYRRDRNSAGVTTEFAAFLVFWLAYALRYYETPAISTAIVLTIVLAFKQNIHQFVREKVSEVEFYDTLKFLAVVFVVLPLLPNREMGPHGFINPTHTWLLVILVSTISYTGYLLTRWLGASRGLRIGSLVGGLVSTTAVTMSLAQRSRSHPGDARRFALVGVMANAVQFPRLLLLVGVVNQDLGRVLAPALLGMGAMGLAGAWIIERLHRSDHEQGAVDLSLENPYSLAPALKFGAFLVGVSLISKIATQHYGSQGVYVASALAGTGDASAISLSVARLSQQGELGVQAAAAAVYIAAATNAAVKWTIAWLNGTRQLALWLGAGFVVMLGTGAALLFASHAMG